jgi:ATP synthase protein I
MSILAPVAEPEVEASDESSDFRPLTAEQAQALREQNPSISPWWVVAGQVLVGVLVTLAAWAVSSSLTVAWSAGFGALAVVIPGALFARGVTGRFASANAGSAVMSFFVWELVKIAVTVAVMFTAYRVVENLSWPAMLVGLVVTMKVYWVALRFGRKSRPVQNVTLNGKSN